jgi:hypothetical protein
MSAHRSIAPIAVTLVAIVTASASGCVRIYDDAAKADASRDAPAVGGVCDTKYGGYAFVQTLGAKVVDGLLADCRLQAHFASLPPARLPHLRQCFALQLGSILQCTRDGARVKYPGLDDGGVLCRDMKSAHAGNGFTAADFSAFVAIVEEVLEDAKLDEEDEKAVLATFGNATTKKDVVESTATTLSNPAPGCDAAVDADASAPYPY